ncbi:TonB-dependent receptor [Ferrimonas marina]|uniref:TonB-dependent receptor n=1 Tax=Ferrimonas marina TaxID=299255 RepID=A0A1M5MG99_9GAMM|nr:TonB-dependent receptor [Ferrimonas marina]SHG76162.1 TonB-dependent receptor [Ferrimonas marina]
MDSKDFKKTKVASSLALALGLGFTTHAIAADDPGAAQQDKVETIVVRGMRDSLIKSMDIKRDSDGVVDVITAEDIGKFPDTNLAESLQRISGVSIDRNNGEGSKVTVRGFGPDFNLVMLNNRLMPTAQANSVSTRSFEFANIASESVSAVEISKTGKANVTSGGIGSTINIQTARPLQQDGLVASFGAKGLHDTSVVNGDDITPEFSGIFSNVFLDRKIGLGVSASYQERDFRSTSATIDGWRQNIHGDMNPNADVTDNNQNPYGNTFYARNVGFNITDVERERANAQVVFQYAPTDTLTFTTDYTYSRLRDSGINDSWGLWFDGPGSATSATINENGTFVNVTEVGGDYSGTMTQSGSENENKSLGFNVEWQATELLTLRFDAHNSTATSEGSLGNSTSAHFFIAGALNIADKTYDVSNTQIPIMGANFVNLNPNGGPHLQPEDYATLFSGIVAGKNETEVTQFQFDGTLINDSHDSLASIDFGLAHTTFDTRAQGSYHQEHASWYGNKGAVAHMMQYAGLGGDFLGGFSGGGSDILIPYYYTYDFDTMVGWAENEYGVEYVAAPFTDDHFIEEKTTSAYIQFNIESEFNGMPLDVVAGLRYEQTDVDARSLQQEASYIKWLTPTEWVTVYADDATYSNETHSYKEFLPSIDAKLDLTHDLVARASYSKTMTRPSLDAMRATTSLGSQPKVGSRTGFAGNTQLSPYKSDNFDLSFEYYYNVGSYVSAGWFAKYVENFLVNTIDSAFYDHIRDPYLGAAAEQARSEIIAAGGTPSDYAVFDWLIANGYGDGNGNIVANPDDPVAEWLISRPNNVEDLSVRGWEVAIQHMFGESGFGVAANATFVSGDTSYDVERVDEQFALPGLSDSANFTVFYDKHGFQARLAYNWRDEFLSATGQAESGGPAPQFTEAYGQLDFSASYQLTERWVVFAEGINILEEDMRIHGRYQEQLLLAQNNEARYAIGTRYTW